MTIDLRKHHIRQLSFEGEALKQLENFKKNKKVNRATLVASSATLIGLATSANAALESDEPGQLAQKVQDTLQIADDREMIVQLVNTLSSGHSRLEELAIEAGVRIMEVSGGLPPQLPKDPEGLQTLLSTLVG